jgi:catechol 2,3-dioxygenase-like lactoylglutathione lyase family enzyme
MSAKNRKSSNHTPTKLNHVDLQVSDVERSREFFENFFDFRCEYQRKGEIAILKDEAGFSLGVSNLFNSPPPNYPPDFHIGFILEREDDIRPMYERFKAAGVSMKAEFSRRGPNVYFVCLAPDSIAVEVSAPKDK